MGKVWAYRKKKLKEYFWNIFVNGFLASYIVPNRMRISFLRVLGVKFGKENGKRENYIWEKSAIMSNKLILGYKANINRFCCIDNTNALVTIGDYSALSYNVTILTSDHEEGNGKRRYGSLNPKEVTIGKGVWIGSNAVILPGVTIGDGCIIAAGAVVSNDCEDNSMYAGVPAVYKKRLK